MILGHDFYNAFAAGVSLAPTSVGIALKLLHESKALNTYFGQAIITAAFVDDILSLMLYNVLFSIKGDITFMTFFPLLMGVIFMVITAIAGALFWPRFLPWMFERVPDKKKGQKLT